MDRELRTRWTDDRLDDLSNLVHANDERIDRNSELLMEIRAGQKEIVDDVTQIMRTGDRRSDRNWSFKLAVFTVLATSTGSLVVNLVHLAVK